LYTATSSPGGLTGTLATAGSGTITVSGLSIGTAYTFTVKATNSVGQSAASAASNSITPSLPAIGSAYAGGFFAGQISVNANGVATHNLVVGPLSSAQLASTQYRVTRDSTPGAESVINGPGNQAAMVSIGIANFPAGQFCENLVTGGFSDWYMPAVNELAVCYFGLKPTTQNNVTYSGANTNAVPSRPSNYTTGNPAQTSAVAFQSGGSEAFASNFYWSSTSVYGTDQVRRIAFYNGVNVTSSPNTTSPVRAIRRVAV
jgi:hypothetical protein